MNIVQIGNPVFSYDINYRRNHAIDCTKRADAMVETAGRVVDVMHLLGSIIARTRPTELPMTWSIYPERIWSQNAKPVVTINPSRVNWDDIEYAYNDGSTHIEQITKAAVVIYVTCEPCWEAYRRWSSVIIDDFYKSMQAVRSYFGIKWEDISKTQDVTWGEVEFRYISKAPISVIRQDIPHCDYYGDTVNERVTDVRVHFSLTVPNFPDDQKNAANCHVIEEEVTTTSTRKVKRLRCE